MLRLRGTFDGEYISFDLVASLTRLQQLLADHLERHYPGELVTVTVRLHPEARGRASRRHEEYVCDPVWQGREWIVWETPQADAARVAPPSAILPERRAGEEEAHAPLRLLG